MTSKKHRKKLKQQYTKKIPNKMYLTDREQVLNYFKSRPFQLIKGEEIISNNNLEFDSTGGVSRTIKAIKYYNNVNIESFRGKNGGYIYYA